MATKTRTITRNYLVKRSRRRANRFNLPVAVVAGFTPLVGEVISGYQSGGVTNALANLANRTTGYDPRDNSWNFQRMAIGLTPIIAGVLVHKFIGGKLGVNRAIGAAGIPFLRI